MNWNRKILYILFFLPPLIFSVYWTIYFEIIVWHETVIQSLQTSWYNWIIMAVSVGAIILIIIQPHTELELLSKEESEQ